MLADSIPDAGEVSISEPQRVFGGNARQAWTLTASWTTDGERRVEEMILLVRQQGSQVLADPTLEYQVLAALSEHPVRSPRVWAQDPDARCFSGSAVLLQRLSGHTDAVSFLNADPSIGRDRTLDLAHALAELHQVPVPEMTAVDEPVERLRHEFPQVRREPLPTVSWALDWLEDNRPDIHRTTLVHGDFRPGNVLYEAGAIVGILDWELAHIGDPLEDIAWAYRALWSPERFVPLTEFVAAYESATGVPVDLTALRWHRILAELKYVIISLRGATSFSTGSVHNLRLIDRTRTVAPSLRRCVDWIAEAESEVEQ
ncbi:putative phosphotransferase [Gordonia polyisoprenivorans NBRC 16320 = JCM 10675]|uniref:Phosphotransferase family protein n=2 Tax=Gordonia polyisoprenivorans TaxID=84595 RepID=A0A846WRY7_9ACTN|nr:phosphotransferase family protein [Gordonia polyisoprenivorans]OZC29482.1 phosphotransferase family protein [Gordonia polyisoprenivorans]GAB25473.1 putative phosphotransferase [Gordonia polyisoprenivorans NBRC 16320 = JCM 10675]